MTAAKVLTRRNLLKTVAFAGTGLIVSESFAATSPSVLESALWSSKAISSGQHAAGAVKRHPFITEVSSGALAKPAFLAYMALNIDYLAEYAKSLDLLGSRVAAFSDLKAESEQLSVWAKETLGVRDWCRTLYQDVAGKPYAKKRHAPLAAGLDYARFERIYATKYDVAVGMAALLPCFWIYEEVGEQIAKLRQLQGNPYAQWLESFATDASAESALKAINLADTLASRADETVQRQMTDIFVAGCWKEFACFDAAYGTLFRHLGV